MVELLRYLEANGFRTFIASGGDRDFMRPFAERAVRHPAGAGRSAAPSGSTSTTGTTTPASSTSREIDFFDDGPEKPVRIWSRIGRRPLVAGGNSNGDVPMLRFARSGDRQALRLLVLHDDAEREFDYTDGAEDALQRADDRGWTVISMKDDWATVFPEP